MWAAGQMFERPGGIMGDIGGKQELCPRFEHAGQFGNKLIGDDAAFEVAGFGPRVWEETSDSPSRVWPDALRKDLDGISFNDQKVMNFVFVDSCYKIAHARGVNVNCE